MPLPFKARPSLLNNCKLAEKRLSHIKTRLNNNPGFKEQYVKFVNKMLQDGDCEHASKVQILVPCGMYLIMVLCIQKMGNLELYLTVQQDKAEHHYRRLRRL